jgi:hypothetical protein
VSVGHKDVKASLDFHMFEVSHFNILIGHPIKKLLVNLLESGILRISLGNESLAIPITRTINIVAHERTKMHNLNHQAREVIAILHLP